MRGERRKRGRQRTKKESKRQEGSERASDERRKRAFAFLDRECGPAKPLPPFLAQSEREIRHASIRTMEAAANRSAETSAGQSEIKERGRVGCPRASTLATLAAADGFPKTSSYQGNAARCLRFVFCDSCIRDEILTSSCHRRKERSESVAIGPSAAPRRISNQERASRTFFFFFFFPSSSPPPTTPR